ncbi:MAG: hypothetical protein IAG13_24860 [Deltaproteobacteria bacterium]|nr:hypothetical protein [Nannocystaceae bacterium]
MMRVGAALALVLVACGPAVSIDDGGEGSSSSGAATSTSTTSMSTSLGTSMTSVGASDEVTSIDPSDDSSGVAEDATLSVGFIENPDGGSCSCECDLWDQDCPRGDKCTPWSNDGGNAWNAVRCSEIVREPAAVGEPCVAQDSPVSGLDDCEMGALCWHVDPATLEGQCVALCTGTEANPSCDAGRSCFIGFEGTVNVCLPTCDPLQPSCAADEACVVTQRTPGPSSAVCLPTPPFNAGRGAQSCFEFEQCGDGLACTHPYHVPACTDGNGCCTPIGTLDAPPMCPDATQTCLPLFADGVAPPGLEQLCGCGIAS